MYKEKFNKSLDAYISKKFIDYTKDLDRDNLREEWYILMEVSMEIIEKGLSTGLLKADDDDLELYKKVYEITKKQIRENLWEIYGNKEEDKSDSDTTADEELSTEYKKANLVLGGDIETLDMYLEDVDNKGNEDNFIFVKSVKAGQSPDIMFNEIDKCKEDCKEMGYDVQQVLFYVETDDEDEEIE